MSIWTPHDAIHPVGVPYQRLAHACAFRIPELDGAIPTRADQRVTVGGKGQSLHPVAMPHECPHTGSWPDVRYLPQPNLPIKVARGKPASIRTPSYRAYRAGMRQRLHLSTSLEIPEPGGGIIAPSGQQVAIGSNGQALDAIRVPA